MDETNLKPLPEDVTNHCMGPWKTHPDGRECAYHNRLGKWTTPNTFGYFVLECTRSHE